MDYTTNLHHPCRPAEESGRKKSRLRISEKIKKSD
jgi:hypothetical protein